MAPECLVCASISSWTVEQVILTASCLMGSDQEQPTPKRAKTSSDVGKPSTTGAAKPAQLQQAEEQAMVPSVLQSLQPPAPPSPPRKLLDGPKRKKKKKQATADPAAVVVKSSLSSFLQSLRPGMSK
jgi:hypothetical protein